MITFFRALFKSLHFVKYRLIEVELKDGSVLFAAVTKNIENTILRAIYQDGKNETGSQKGPEENKK